MDMDEAVASRIVNEINQQIQSQKEYEVRNIINTSYKSLVVQNITEDFTVNHDAIDQHIETDKTCCSHRLSKEYNVPKEKIDNMKTDLVQNEIRGAKMENIKSQYNL